MLEKELKVVKEFNNGVKLIEDIDRGFYFLRPNGKQVNEVPFQWLGGVRGDFAFVGFSGYSMEEHWYIYFIGNNTEEKEIYASIDLQKSKDEQIRCYTDSFNNSKYLPFWKYKSLSKKGYVDILGNFSEEKTQLGEDLFKYVKGEISVYDLNKDYFKDPKVIKLVREQERKFFKSQVGQAQTEEDMEQVRQAMLDFNSYMYSMFDEEYQVWQKQEDIIIAFKNKKKECEEIADNIL